MCLFGVSVYSWVLFVIWVLLVSASICNDLGVYACVRFFVESLARSGGES